MKKTKGDLVTCLICGKEKPRNTSLEYDLNCYQCRDCWVKSLDDNQRTKEYWNGQVYA